MDSDIQRIIRKPLSDDDLRTILGGNIKIIKYKDLSRISSLNMLLPGDVDFVIILIETEPSSGIFWNFMTLTV